MQQLDIELATLPPSAEVLRQEVRDFIQDALPDFPAHERARSWTGFSPEFSRALGKRGWIGMTWSKRYGGAERSTLERYVVLEELLAAGAPVAAHWTADRQSGPVLMRYSPDNLAPKFVPAIVRGECFFCIGLSEPDAGSDLAAIRTRAYRDGNEWVITGRKLWTSNAHRSHYMIALVRTADKTEARHQGMSQFLIDMNSPGLTVSPVINQLGEHELNEVTFDDVRVPLHHLIGEEGNGWNQVTTELTFERSGPERYMSSTQLLLEMLKVADADNPHHAVELGRLAARYATLRQMSMGISGMLAVGKNPAMAAATVKDQGAHIEQRIPEVAQELFSGNVSPNSTLAQVADYFTLVSPSFSLRGGTPQILRGIIAKGMGLR